jgi:hypothetical protein
MTTLLFLLVVLVTFVTLLVLAFQLLRGHFTQAGKLLAGLAVGLVFYFAALLAVSLTAPQRIVPMEADRCFDEWCVTVVDVRTETEIGGTQAQGIFYVVELKLSSHSRGRTQRAASAAVHLLDEQGRRYDLSPAGMFAFETKYGSIPPLTLFIEAGRSYETYQIFDLLKDAGKISLTVEHPVGFSPGWFIIGDEDSLFHKPTIVPLP